MSRNLKQLLNTKVKDLWDSTELVSGSAEIGKTFWDCVIPLVSSATLLTQGVSVGLFAIGFAAKSIKFFGEKTKAKLLLPEWVLLAALFAYIESFKTLGNTDFVNEKIKNIVLNFLYYLKKSGDFELTEAQAKDVLRCFHESELAEEFNGILSTLVKQAGLSVNEAEILTKRVACGTHRYLNEALASVTDKVPAFVQLYRDGWRKESEKYHDLDKYLEKKIATKPQERINSDELITFQQIYVSLEVKPGNKKDGEYADNLEAWAKRLLLDQTKQDQVLFIQAGPGRGKSVFCRMFADQVRRELHPIWTPILIRLRDIITFENSLENTLKAVIKEDFVKNDDGWLTNKNTRYLFLLDGFDELVLERRNIKTLQDFLTEVGQFQKDYSDIPGVGHRVLITGRSLALHSIETWLPDNIERVEILPMDDELQQQWFVKWEAIVGATKNQAFQALLKDKDCPGRVQELAKEPLLLYLLAAMHRDERIKVEDFAEVISAKIVIYEKALDWVLTKQRKPLLNQKLTGQETKDLQRILTEAGLCVVQSGGECAAISMIEERLQSDASAKALLEKAEKDLGESALKNALATFYLQTGSKDGSVEFCHKSFGEFLCAKRIKESLINWTKPGSQRQKFDILDEQFDWEIYDLLGYGGLTPEIVEYLTALLKKDGEFRQVELFQRLEDFYLRWCDGELIDAPPKKLFFINFPQEGNLPQHKMRLLRTQVENSNLGQRQVDIYTGLNVMILLLELNRYAQSQDELKDQVVFYPCGQPDTENFDQFRLGRLIGYCHCIDAGAFTRVIGSFLSNTNLNDANLKSANLGSVSLSSANLSNANLSHANLDDANLENANLSSAKLIGAYLNSAYLIAANLIGANLSGAYLSSANLSGAYLSSANLIDANLSGAYLSDTNLSDANLSSANLINASFINNTNLSSANLINANLSSANLENANLSNAHLNTANLSHAHLSSANLRGANLSNAHLNTANLRGANLMGADLSGANLRGVNLMGADLENVRWDENTNWDNVQGLETAQNVPEALKQQLGLS
ncbi:pentapeptide repeat-containing protein [Microcoleus sp. FACHB-68]|uniref:pentapeptide repeat-containing protein n=1 Tax=Microcoleus sp. FACHB-68 TaxID=2692826 RepID=UPI001684B49F|nr:pentapeptide repeat-containing protein [Microcoleus sp. FACHB-68]MBD1935861.1 pentapeptide repeat-containing protein [Microcoleus sp. FACHB-68]